MIKVAHNIYCNFQPKKAQFTGSNRPISAIVIGKSGSGKTCLINNLCQSNYKCGASRQSITQQLIHQNCKAIPSLTLWDTPEISRPNKRCSFALKQHLGRQKFNVLIIQAKLGSRFEDTTLTELSQMKKLFEEQAQNRIIFFISYLDTIQTQTKEQQNRILKSLSQSLNKFGLQRVVLYSNKEAQFVRVAEIIYGCGLQSQEQIILKINSKKFSIHMDISESEYILDQNKSKKQQQFDSLQKNIEGKQPSGQQNDIQQEIINIKHQDNSTKSDVQLIKGQEQNINDLISLIFDNQKNLSIGNMLQNIKFIKHAQITKRREQQNICKLNSQNEKVVSIAQQSKEVIENYSKEPIVPQILSKILKYYSQASINQFNYKLVPVAKNYIHTKLKTNLNKFTFPFFVPAPFKNNSQEDTQINQKLFKQFNPFQL